MTINCPFAVGDIIELINNKDHDIQRLQLFGVMPYGSLSKVLEVDSVSSTALADQLIRVKLYKDEWFWSRCFRLISRKDILIVYGDPDVQ
jgi:hypothetical protein